MAYCFGLLGTVGFLGFGLQDHARGRHFSAALDIITSAVLFTLFVAPKL